MADDVPVNSPKNEQKQEEEKEEKVVNKITITVKTPKEKETFEVDEECLVKDVSSPIGFLTSL